MAAATRRGEVAALVDSVDRFDPAMAAEAGVDVSRLLWVRGPSVTTVSDRAGTRTPEVSADAILRRALRAADLIVRAGGFGVVVLDVADLPVPTVRRVPASSWRA